MNGGQQLTANCFAAWLCLVQPALMFMAGVYFGRHGLRQGLLRIYLGLGGGRAIHERGY